MKQKRKRGKSLMLFLSILDIAKAVAYLEDCFTRHSSFQSQQVEIEKYKAV